MDKDLTRQALKESEEFRKILSLYDYVEIQPLCNNMFITRKNPSEFGGSKPMNENDIRIINELLVETADDHNMPVCATTDSHFLNKEDGRYRKYMMMNMGFNDAEMQSDLYFRTTDEMLDEFKYLGEEKAMEVVVDNTNMIADLIEFGIKPFPDGSYPPQIARAAADVRDIAYTKANRMYRHNGVLNEVVKARLDRELESIIGNGYAIMYYIAYRLVKKSNNDGYVVGSRGSVGSSFAATMCGISEVNPLPPHYRCPKCNFAEFDNSGKYGSGYDLPPKNCPECGEKLIPDGQDIPFETFLGFKGDKQPDIDLNFSGEYQPRAHAYVGVLFGGTHTFKAGTIGAYQDKNAFGICRKICEERGEPFTQAHLAFMARDIIGVKRTTSQHPGGIVVIAKEMDIYEFTPIQFPAEKTDGGIITTHFDFRAMHDTILKLDILGHADPTVLRMLSDITGVNISDIPIPDEKVMSLLVNTDALGFPIEATDAGSATLGLSELGTNMARGMIKETKPTRFYDLVQLMGLSHGTDVWTGNAQDLIRNGTCDLNSVIGCRDSIMTSLIYWGLPNKDAFDIMEGVRKGKVAAGKVKKWPEYVEEMKSCGVPDWYIESCQKIKYMFPKAHAAAYAISTLRVAWFKVYYPEEYYCSFFTHRGEGLFDAVQLCNGPERVKKRRIELADEMHAKGDPNTKLKYYFYELVEEMYARGITFAPITLNDSLGKKFVKAGDKLIRPPFCAIPGVSEANGIDIENARNEGEFKNRDDFMKRTGVGQSVTQKILDYGGILDDLPESAQINLFDLFDDNSDDKKTDG
jgi:DNA polymerase III alpha chain